VADFDVVTACDEKQILRCAQDDMSFWALCISLSF